MRIPPLVAEHARPFLVAALLAAPLLAVALAHADGGGTVSNALPTFESFSNSLGGTTSLNAVDTLTGVVRDANEEADLLQLRIATTSGPKVESSHAVSAGDVAGATKPATYVAGWKVWNPVPGDGKISWEYQTTYTTLGTYVWQINAKDEATEQTYTTALTVVVGDPLQVAVDPVDMAGNPVPGGRWGAWNGPPGAANVAATNFLKVTNVGTVATQALVLDFSAAAFTGAGDASKSVPIDGNIQFAVWEDASPGTTAPSEGTFAYGAPSGTGSVTATFTGVGHVMYISYRLVSLPSILPDQGYGAGFTISPA